MSVAEGDGLAGVHSVGRRALLVTCADPAGVAVRLADAATAAGVALAEVVPGAETVLVVASYDRAVADLRAAVRAALAAPGAIAGLSPEMPDDTGGGEVVDIAVRYDGPDLETVAQLTRSSSDAVVAAHSGARYRGAFSGFAPGFCYLEGLPEALRVPRRPDPRARVPAGAVAIADRFSAVYPRSSPGGWQLIGVTGERLWDSARIPPALVRPGTTVRFHPIP